MTVAALRALLDEIDTQGGPEAARHNRLHLPDEGTSPMTTAPARQPAPPVVDVQLKNSAAVRLREPEPPTVGQLLKWGDDHDDKTVQAHAATARTALEQLRARYAADQELTAITTEAEQLEKRLAELRAREQELTPVKPKRKSPLDYDAGVVRAWARERGIECPDRGRVPKDVVAAWREATRSAAA